MKTLIILLLSFGIATSLFAAPTEEDRQSALTLMYTLVSDQELYFRETSNYQTVQPRMVDNLIVSSCAYSTFSGKGYIVTVTKVENGRAYIIQRHEGDANPTISERWTCANCNGESYSITPAANEHGFCQINEN